VKRRLPLCLMGAGLLLAWQPLLRAGDLAPAGADSTASPAPAEDFSAPPASPVTLSYDLDADASYVGDARTNFGRAGQGDVSEAQSSARLVLGMQKGGDSPIFRLGLSYERYDFGLSKGAPVPNILQAANLVVGVDFQAFNSWLVRLEADPGFYNDARSTAFRNFNVPFSLGGSYIASENLQWIVGLGGDFNRQIPVIPAIGVRWAVTDDLVIDAVLPTPRIEYSWSKALTLYVGCDLDDGTYRLDRHFGNGVGATVVKKEVTTQKIIGYRIVPPFSPQPIYQVTRQQVSTTVPGPDLNNAVVEYDEVRIGAGFTWKASKAFTFEMEAGYLPYREFDFHRADVHFSNDDGAAYGRMSVNAQF